MIKINKNDFRGKIKKKIKDIPENLGITALALLFGLAEGGAAALDEILKGPGRGLSKSYDRMLKTKKFWDYYNELKDLKENSARTILWRLQKKGFVAKKEKSYLLTAMGIKIVKKIQEKPERIWDGKWRMIMFDIPEKKRGERDWLRWQLAIFEYKPLQKSVFVGQWPFEEDFYKKIIDRKIDQYIRLITVGEIDDERILE